ncbi:hypothetical protein LPJ64_004575 [Coemansia asiatica]|uniref:Uncharacterized protein n=1 Tax=Coemansia asiatica TaxID=1052880 RepID=A0A9W8CIW8_9FUNG|nr:hypothetical protein LPJ64_004575 [Coemansia asiatica]
MPRPTRRQQQKQVKENSSRSTTTATTDVHHSRLLRSHTRHSSQQQQQPSLEKTPSPAKPSIMSNSPLSDFPLPHTPKPLSPRYGRRISHGSPAGRRISLGGAGSVFDGLIDGFSPIKAGPPPPQEEQDLSDLVSVDLEKEYSRFAGVRKRPSTGDKSVTGTVVDDEKVDLDEMDTNNHGSIDDDEDDESSGEFDIDKLVAAGRNQRSARKPLGASDGNTARVNGSSLLLPSGLPKRNRTLKPVISKKKATNAKKKTTIAKTTAAKTTKTTNSTRNRNRQPTTTSSYLAAAAAAAERHPQIIYSKGFDDIDDFKLVEETV